MQLISQDFELEKDLKPLKESKEASDSFREKVKEQKSMSIFAFRCHDKAYLQLYTSTLLYSGSKGVGIQIKKVLRGGRRPTVGQ